jgi:hypothetical protein
VKRNDLGLGAQAAVGCSQSRTDFHRCRVFLSTVSAPENHQIIGKMINKMMTKSSNHESSDHKIIKSSNYQQMDLGSLW